MPRRFEHHFEWDPLKARANLRKHAVTFERAATVFMDPMAMSRFDNESSQEEERCVTLGLDKGGVPLVVCHTYRKSEKTVLI